MDDPGGFGGASDVVAEGQGMATLSKSRVYPFDMLQGKPNGKGFISRPVVEGVLATGETVEMHESTLPPGQLPHEPHRHRQSEFLMVREGQLEFYNDGVPQPIGPGGVVFVASNVLHGMKNVGDTPAHYFVVSIGKDA